MILKGKSSLQYSPWTLSTAVYTLSVYALYLRRRPSNDLVTTPIDSIMYWVTWDFLCSFICLDLDCSVRNKGLVSQGRTVRFLRPTELCGIQNRYTGALDNKKWGMWNERKGFPETSELRKNHWGCQPGILRSNVGNLWKVDMHQLTGLWDVPVAAQAPHTQVFPWKERISFLQEIGILPRIPHFTGVKKVQIQSQSCHIFRDQRYVETIPATSDEEKGDWHCMWWLGY